MSIDFKKLDENWASPFVARSEIEKFTGGLYKPKSMNTFDAAGCGVNPRYKIGKKVFYRISDLVIWLKNKQNKEEH